MDKGRERKPGEARVPLGHVWYKEMRPKKWNCVEFSCLVSQRVEKAEKCNSQEKVREMDKSRERKPGEARAALRHSMREKE
ncbi:hypothetical protein Tco_1430577 [Tanacetum coccineum]